MQTIRFMLKDSETSEVLASGEDVVGTVKEIKIKDLERKLALVDRVRGTEWHVSYDCMINGVVLTEPRGEPGYISLKE